MKFPTTCFWKFCFITYCSLTEWTHKSKNVIFRCNPLRCSAIAVKRNDLLMMTNYGQLLNNLRTLVLIIFLPLTILLQMDANLTLKPENVLIRCNYSVDFAITVERTILFEIWWKNRGYKSNYLKVYGLRFFSSYLLPFPHKTDANLKYNHIVRFWIAVLNCNWSIEPEDEGQRVRP